jgi:hypothetical protein
MSETVYEVTYRIALGNLNAFFGAWLKRTWFDRTNWKRLGLHAVAFAIFFFWSIWHYVGGKTPIGFSREHLLILGSIILIESVISAFAVVFIAYPPLTYVLQLVAFAFGPMRTRTSHLKTTTAGVDKTTGDISSQTKWRDFAGVVVTRRTVLLFTHRNSATIVPKSAFASPAEAEAFAAFAKAQWNEAHSVF